MSTMLLLIVFHALLKHSMSLSYSFRKINQLEKLHPRNWNSANTYEFDNQRNTRHTIRNPETLTRNVTFIHAVRYPQKNVAPYKEH
jgi:hypothetical protein